MAFLGNAAFAFRILAHMVRTMGPDFRLLLKKLWQAPTMKEKMLALTTPFVVDPYVIRKVVHSIEGDYTFLGDGKTFIPRDFDLFIRCSTELSHRGDSVPVLFDRWFQGSALNAQPDRYGSCPFGKWEDFRLMEPHLMSKHCYPEQVAHMERIVDDYMALRVGQPMQIGPMLRLLIWDLYCFTSYGEGPSDDTAQLLQLFEDHSPEFDYAVRMCTNGIEYQWSDKLSTEIYGIGDWCWRVANERKRNIDKYPHKNDVLSNMIREHPDMDLAKMEGALRGVFTGGMNNCHSAVCGTLIEEAKGRGRVAQYLSADPAKRIEHVLREALRVFTAIPTARYVRPEDDFVVDGKRLAPGTSVVLSTFAINTDARNWQNPDAFQPSRFEGTEEIGFMCQRGFVPLGAAAEIGGRMCGARFHDAHMLRVIIGKLLRDYRWEEIGTSRGFEMKQSAGTSMFAGSCKIVASKR